MEQVGRRSITLTFFLARSGHVSRILSQFFCAHISRDRSLTLRGNLYMRVRRYHLRPLLSPSVQRSEHALDLKQFPFTEVGP